ncbi:hypothetical protein RDABS01_011000 [Bienertia sinuspersici]
MEETKQQEEGFIKENPSPPLFQKKRRIWTKSIKRKRSEMNSTCTYKKDPTNIAQLLILGIDTIRKQKKTIQMMKMVNY